MWFWRAVLYWSQVEVCVFVCAIECWARVQRDTGVLNWVSVFISQGGHTHSHTLTEFCCFKVNPAINAPAHAMHKNTHTHIQYVCMHTHINISQTSRIRSYSCIETKTLCMNHTEEEGGRVFFYIYFSNCVKIQFTRLPCPRINPQGSPVRGRSTPLKERL